MKVLTPDGYFGGPTNYTHDERSSSEKKIEKASTKWARDHGWFSRKYSSPGQMGVQDRIFVKKGHVVFIEYKRVGKEPTGLQCDDAEHLMAHGGRVYWTNTLRGTQQILGGT